MLRHGWNVCSQISLSNVLKARLSDTGALVGAFRSMACVMGEPLFSRGQRAEGAIGNRSFNTHWWLYIHIQSCKRSRYYLSASGGGRRHFLGLDVRLYRHQHHISPNTSKQICTDSRTILSSPQQAYQQPTATSTSTTAPEGTRGELSPGPFGYGVVLVVVVVRGGRGCGGRVVVWSCGRGVVIRRSKNAPKRHYQLQLWLITKAKAQGQTSNPSPSPIPLDTPALPVNMFMIRSGSKSSSTPENNSHLLEHGWDDSY